MEPSEGRPVDASVVGGAPGRDGLPGLPCAEASSIGGCMDGQPGEPPAPVVDPVAVAQEASESLPLVVPQPHTSPSEDGFQLVGIETWYWLDAAAWRPVVVRAEVPGVWVEVTARPTTATWDPGDGRPAVACAGPGAAHPGTNEAATECGHTYLEIGSFVIGVEVAFEVTWVASTGQTGTIPDVVLSAQLPVTVEQRQAVID
jgi:hypothetical protein